MRQDLSVLSKPIKMDSDIKISKVKQKPEKVRYSNNKIQELNIISIDSEFDKYEGITQLNEEYDCSDASFIDEENENSEDELFTENSDNENVCYESDAQIKSEDVDEPNYDNSMISCDLQSESSCIPEKLEIQNPLNSDDEDIDNKHFCDLCDYSCDEKLKLRKHLLTHECDQCDFRAKEISNLNRHKKCHDKDKIEYYKCNLCDFNCLSNSDLKTHHSLIHGNHKEPHLYNCDQCHYRAYKLHNLLTHKSTHLDDKPFACDQCEYKAKSRRYLTKHKWIHNKSKGFKCEHCGSVLQFQCELKKHYSLKHPMVKLQKKKT